MHRRSLRDTPRVIHPAAEIEALAAFENRQPGTDGERRAAKHLANRLDDEGRDARTEPILIWPRWHLTHLIHALVAIAGSAISVGNALIGTILAAIVLVLITTVARLAGLHNVVLEIVQFIPTVALIIGVPYLADIALSGPVPGANDNASGVVTVLRLAERYGGTLDHLDLWVLLPGAQEAGALGTRAWLKQHRRSLNSRATIVLNVD